MESLVHRYLCLTQTTVWRNRTGEGEKQNGKGLAYSLRTSWETSEQKNPAAVEHPGTAIHGSRSLGTALYVYHVAETETEAREGWSGRCS
jgi:hypothetical protein